jgi:hypothetical protein
VETLVKQAMNRADFGKQPLAPGAGQRQNL